MSDVFLDVEAIEIERWHQRLQRGWKSADEIRREFDREYITWTGDSIVATRPKSLTPVQRARMRETQPRA